MDRKEKIADDILIGAKAIAEETGFTERQIYAKQGNLGLTHLGALLVGSKSELKRRLTNKAA